MAHEVRFTEGVLTIENDGLVIINQPHDEFGAEWESEAAALSWGEVFLDGYLNPPVPEVIEPEIIETEIVEEDPNAIDA